MNQGQNASLTNSINGFLSIHKPIGITAHDCIAKLRKLLKHKKIGHSGTLDPMATGVLPVGMGQATRLLRFLPEGKAYRAVIRFGILSDTDDITGQIIERHSAAHLTLDQIQQQLPPLNPQFIGNITQRPPAYSAIHINGQRLYDLARQGKLSPDDIAQIPTRTVHVSAIDILGWQHTDPDHPELTVHITCGTGTYIRSIARDLGAALGTVATLAALERTSSNGFNLEQSYTFSQLEAVNLPQTIRDLILPLDSGIAHLPPIILSAELALRWCQGRAALAESLNFDPSNKTLADQPYIRVYDASSQLLGVGQWQIPASDPPTDDDSSAPPPDINLVSQNLINQPQLQPIVVLQPK
ncbi:MAG: tRNA pseudouridine(55) synthase TruB [Pseudanabaena sp. ELA607]